jgi:hypothetical protein
MAKDKKNQSLYLQSPTCHNCRNAELVENIAFSFLPLWRYGSLGLRYAGMLHLEEFHGQGIGPLQGLCT